MISIFKKKIQQPPDLSGLVTDMHSHLVPGVDDGAPDVSTSLELIKGLTDLGFQKFIATPHVLWDLYKNTPDKIKAAYEQLVLSLKQEQPNVRIGYAAEYFLDYHVDELVEDQQPLLTIKDNWVLVEFSFVSAPLDLKDKLFALQLAGYQPVIAHPERYTYFGRNKEVYNELREAGYLFQLNLLSLTGYYGRIPEEIGNMLIKHKFVDLIGTDLHHTRHLQALRNNPHLTDVIKMLQDSGTLLNPTL
jgi:tyrosine-protein phosphatase YwqE